MRLVEALYLDTGLFHLVYQGLPHLQATDPVEQPMRAHAGTRSLFKRIDEFAAVIARPLDVGLERDRWLGHANRGQYQREDLVAVEQRLDLVAFDDPRPEKGAERAPELAIAASVNARQLLHGLLLGAGSLQHQQHHGQRGQRLERDDRDLQLPR